MRIFLLTPLILAACSAPSDESAEPVSIEKSAPVEPGNGMADGAAPRADQVAAPPNSANGTEASALTFPVAIRGKWRQTDGAVPNAALCDNTVASNMGKVLTVREDGYSYFETGGRFISVSRREAGKLRAVFDTTYADTPTRDELTFAVDPVAKTLTVTNHDKGERGNSTYKRCPQ